MKPSTSLSFSDFPYGWFRVAYSDELTPKKVISLRYFERDLVLWRTHDGEVQISEACCSCSTHLKYGKVTATGIRCPACDCGFDRKGSRERIFNSSQTLPQAPINSWSVAETNGIIFVYYCPGGRSQHEPDWKIPKLPEYTDSGWTPVMRRRWQVRTSVYEAAENGVDTAHSTCVHAQTFAALKSKRLDMDKTTSTHHLSFINKLLGQKLNGSLTVTSYGLGCQVSRTIVEALVKLQFTAIFLSTPIDRERLEIDLVFTMKKLANKQLTRLAIAPWLIGEIGKNLEQDIPIWENKIFQSQPLLCDGDGPIIRYRHWARQFYN